MWPVTQVRVHWKNVRSNGESGSKGSCVGIAETCLKFPPSFVTEVRWQYAQTTLLISRIGFVPPRLANAN